MKHINKFDDYIKEFLTIPSTLYEIEEEFDNEISRGDYYHLEKYHRELNFNDKEQLKLNKLFGIWKPHFQSIYTFNTKYGGYGEPITKLKGHIVKLLNMEDKNKIYIIDMVMTIRSNENEGKRTYVLKFDNIDDVINFFKNY